ncbi:flagellar biosynthetic protein FliO [Psychromonas sp. B3M02]|uniref:flagellar biosynthetic protein FliO n=1 Tax=Psychromonas sp. B3M02 TaxID=2267226 RepID=UPI00215D962F|nr:flagellar biosynthetic protein FliO [Psychromonas sp. B3M02]
MKPLIAIMQVAAVTVSLPAVALEETSKRPELAIGTMLGSLILVLACIFLFAFLMKKSNLIRHGGQHSPIKVISTQALTNKSRVQIIEVRGKQYLLGVSEHSVNLLDQLEPVEEETTDIPENPSFKAAFATVLSKVGKKNNE